MIRKVTLKEDTASQAVNSADHGARITIDSKDVKLTDLLDELLERNLETFYTNVELMEEGRLPDKNFVNLLVIGVGGTGKTSIIEQWAHKNNLNLVTKAASIMDEADLNGLPVAALGDKSGSRIPTNEFDSLDEPDSVLFLDEFNRGRATVRGTLLKLIQGHTLPDPQKKGSVKFLTNLLFTIAAVNPADPNYNIADPLDDAELSRFIIYVQGGADKYEYLDWITQTLKKRGELLAKIKNDPRMKSSAERLQANKNRLDLITYLVKDKRFRFDDEEDINQLHSKAIDDTLPQMLLSFRTLTQALYASDGTVDSFLYYYKQAANREKYDLVKLILTPYKEKEDKANQALDKYRQDKVDKVFKTEREVKKDKITGLRSRLKI